MGYYFQVIVDQEISPEGAIIEAAKIRDWLVNRGIIQADLTDCVLNGLGHLPDVNYSAITQEIDVLPQFLHLMNGVNGVKFITTKSIFHTESDTVACPYCYAKDDSLMVMEKLDDWYFGRDSGFTCPKCGQTASVTEWIFDPSWAFGNLGIQFWSWPALKPSFIAEVATFLGHPVKLVVGKL